jgi:gamma-glutamyltranspeptidase
LDFKLDLFDAVGSPRVHHQLMPNQVGTETGFDAAILQELTNRGHKVSQKHFTSPAII